MKRGVYRRQLTALKPHCHLWPPSNGQIQTLIDSTKLAAAKEEFHRLEKEGIVRKSDSEWASPLHMVQKSDGFWRPCGDFRCLNIISEADCYPLPNMADITGGLSGARVFSKLITLECLLTLLNKLCQLLLHHSIIFLTFL